MDVTLTATYKAVSTTAVVTIGAALTDFVLNPNKVQGGTSTTGTITLSCPAPFGGVVSLSTTNAAVVIVPPTIPLAQGQTTATVSVSTKAVTTALDPILTAMFGSKSLSATLHVTVLPLYSITPLPFLFPLAGNSARQTYIGGLNNLGEVVGGENDGTNICCLSGSGWLYRNGTLTNLGFGHEAAAINDSDLIGLTGGSIWQNGQLTSVGSLGSGGTSLAGLDNAGDAAGAAYVGRPAIDGSHAFLWQNGVIHDLGSLCGGSPAKLRVSTG